ncbi:MAG: acetate--CoA ligase family protein [Pseudomonadota bacterium]|nr:acetate--CoA ligase family protein [Pseudomonadota bacterium]
MSPKHIAFFGGRDAKVAIAEAIRRGYAGEIWPVNPNRKEIAGYRCYKSVDELPEAPDASFLAIPATSVNSIIQNLDNRGAGGVVCYTAGFGETNHDGIKLEQELISVSGDLIVIGPNCYGLINYLEHVALWPFAHGGFCPGYGCAIITQSGMLASDITMTQRSVPLTHMISVGNQACIGIEDFIEELCENDLVKAIGIHIEGIKNVNKFQKAIFKCHEFATPVVALKTGSSKVGSSITVTHTGSLAGEAKYYDALFRRTGVIQVSDPVQFLETLKFLSICNLPSKDSVIAFTCSGGGAAMVADFSETINLKLPNFSKDDKKELKSILPSIATVSNPLDYTTPIWGIPEKTYPVFFEAMKRSKAGTAILVQDYPARGFEDAKISYLNDAKSFIEASEKLKIPSAICSTFPENLTQDIRLLLVKSKVAPMQGLRETLIAINSAALLKTRQKKIKREGIKDLFILEKRTRPTTLINEVKSKLILENNSIPTPKRQMCPIDKVTKGDLRYPLVLKYVNDSIVHKTEWGAVEVDIKSEKDLNYAVKKMLACITPSNTATDKPYFLIEEMQSTPVAELLFGILPDSQFGLALTIGSGGTHAEILADTVSILLPTSISEIKTHLKRLSMYPQLCGYRGSERVNITKLSQSILNIADFFQRNRTKYQSIELNPIFVYPQNVCVVDAIIESTKEQNN